MKYRTIKVSELAASSVDTAAYSILKKFVEYANKEELNLIDTSVKTLAIAGACKNEQIFTEKESEYFIANNVEKAIETAEYFRHADNSSKPSYLTNPFSGSSYPFARFMVQHRISEIVDGYTLYIGDSDIETFDISRFVNYLDLFGKTVVDTNGGTYVKVSVPDLAECGFEGKLARMYSKVLRTLANSPAGLSFDDVVFNNDLHPERSTTFASNTLKASLYACLTQKSFVIADWYNAIIHGKDVGFDKGITNPLRDIRKLESAYLVDRVLIILGGDLSAYNIHPKFSIDSYTYILDAKTKHALLDIIESNPETKALKTMFEISRNWRRS